MIKLALKPKYRIKLSLRSDEGSEIFIGSPMSELRLAITNILVGARGPAGDSSIGDAAKQQLDDIANIPNLSLIYQLARQT